MSPELQQKLFEKYPNIFSMPEQTPIQHWGIECGDGWFQLIDTACRLVEYELAGQEELTPVVAVQVKEKWGVLNFYHYGGNDTTDAYIRMAEALSAYICEVCGDSGKLRGGGWLRTLCDEHTLEAGRSLEDTLPKF